MIPLPPVVIVGLVLTHLAVAGVSHLVGFIRGKKAALKGTMGQTKAPVQPPRSN